MLGRCLLLIIAFAPGAGCSGAAIHGDAGVVILDAGIDGGYCHEWYRESGCNPPANVGCSTGERCGLVHPSDLDGGIEMVYDICCMPEGSLPIGADCTVSPNLPDDCVGGSICRWGRCRKLCPAPVTCGRSPCDFLTLDPIQLGTCAPDCDSETFACEPGLSCYNPYTMWEEIEDIACRAAGTAALGEHCELPWQCGPGLTCVRATAEPFALDYAINDGTCQPVCRVALNDCAPGSSCISYLGTNYGACIIDPA